MDKCYLCTKSRLEGVHLHRLPKKTDLKRQWCEWIGSVNGCKWETLLGKNLCICSDHFREADKGLRKLRGGAVPSIVTHAIEQESLSDECKSRETMFSKLTVAASTSIVNDNNNLNQCEYECQSSVAYAPTIATETLNDDTYSEFTSVIEIDMKHSENQNSDIDRWKDCNEAFGDSVEFIFELVEDTNYTQQVADGGENLDIDINKWSTCSDACDNREEPVLASSENNNYTQQASERKQVILLLPENERSDVSLADAETDSVINQFYALDARDVYDKPIDNNGNFVYGIKSESSSVSGNENDSIVNQCPAMDVQDEYCDEPTIVPKAITNRKKQPTRACAAVGCDKLCKKLHTFPSILVGGQINEAALDQCKNWIKNCGNGTLLSVPTFQLNSRYFLCASHFNGDQYVRGRLKPLAEPTSFQCNPVPDTLMNQYPLLFNMDAASNSTAKISRKICAAQECDLKSTKLHTFPSVVLNNVISDDNLERCKLWIKNCGNESLLNEPVNKLHNSYFVCSNHFSDDQYYHTDRKRIRPDAVPSQFICNSLSDSQMQKFPFWNSQVLVTDSGDDRFCEILQKKFEETMNSVKWVVCSKCKSKFFKPKNSNSKCIHSKDICKFYTKENNMDPGDVPDELKGLSYIEEQLIAQVHPVINVFKIKGHQNGYKGNVINFCQNVHKFAKTLPHDVCSIVSNVIVRTRNELNPAEFNVSAGKVKKALLWLKSNNNCYADIELSEENLRQLPENGNVFDKMPNVIYTDSDPDNNFNPSETDTLSDEEDDHPFLMKESGMPMTGKPPESDQIGAVLNWPEMSSEAVNEFKDDGYICRAFPCLFPEGKADLSETRDDKITPLNYFQHLMRYYDERFSKHPRFRYFALNSYMRWTALSSGGVFINKTTGFKNMTNDDLKKALEQNPNLIKKIMFHSANLRGTRPYWYNVGQELLAMVEQLGLPTLFFTLSAADFHWPDLFHFLCPERELSTLTEQDRRKLIQENPAKVDAFFLYRGETFINEVLKKKFYIDDLWFRIEYQHRGSPHIHGLLWLKDAPKRENLRTMSQEDKQVIIDYYDKLISTNNPDIHYPPGPIHPSRIKISEVVDLKADLAMLLNKVQRHTKCSENYCLRKNRKTKRVECRFKFPFATTDWSKLVISEDKDVEFETARNDPKLNKYNEFMIQTWRANMDISPVLSKRALINYLAKYVSKAEKQSQDMNDVLKLLIQNTATDQRAKSIIQKLYVQSCSERDYGAQETCHLLMGLPLYSACGRKFVTLNFRVLDTDAWIPVEKDCTKRSKNFLEKYIERPEMFQNKTVWYMAKHHILPSGRMHPKKREAIVQVYPRIHKRDDDDENFYRQQVLLHVPWRCEEQFLDKYSSWKEAYTACENDIIKDSSSRNIFDNLVPDEAEYDMVENPDDITTEEWMCISKMGPNQTVQEVEMGRRDIDINYDWHAAAKIYDKYGGILAIRDFIQDQKAKSTSEFDIPQMPTIEFTPEQNTVLNLLKLQIESIRKRTSSDDFKLPRSVIVQGKAGTGKSLLIHALKSIIYREFGENSYVLLGPTGVSALNINGSTIHSKLGIHPKSRELIPLNGSALHNFKDKFKNTKFVIIDEYSMIGCSMMHKIAERLKQAMDRENDEFGGLIVYFFGDIQQLGPVGDSPVYNTSQMSPNYIDGRLLYQNIEGSIILSQVKRQSNVEFQSVLNNVSMGTITEQDFQILQRRFKTSVTQEEVKSFQDAIHIFPTINEVDAYNREQLLKLKKLNNNGPAPIARVPAHHNCSAASRAEENEASGLRSILYLAEEAKIMLRTNLWTEKGLVNGAVGKIKHILYSENSNPQEDPPLALVCTFESYKGPFLDDDEKTVVIAPITNKWMNKEQEYTRTQFSVSLCYACSIHKSQGLSLKKAFINIGALREMSPGLTYTALSRVTSLEGLLLEPFSKKRLLAINKANYIHYRLEWLQYLQDRDISLAFRFFLTMLRGQHCHQDSILSRLKCLEVLLLVTLSIRTLSPIKQNYIK